MGANGRLLSRQGHGPRYVEIFFNLLLNYYLFLLSFGLAGSGICQYSQSGMERRWPQGHGMGINRGDLGG